VEESWHPQSSSVLGGTHFDAVGGEVEMASDLGGALAAVVPAYCPAVGLRFAMNRPGHA
jgi:hypothetical protein